MLGTRLHPAIGALVSMILVLVASIAIAFGVTAGAHAAEFEGESQDQVHLSGWGLPSAPTTEDIPHKSRYNVRQTGKQGSKVVYTVTKTISHPDLDLGKIFTDTTTDLFKITVSKKQAVGLCGSYKNKIFYLIVEKSKYEPAGLGKKIICYDASTKKSKCVKKGKYMYIDSTNSSLRTSLEDYSEYSLGGDSKPVSDDCYFAVRDAKSYEYIADKASDLQGVLYTVNMKTCKAKTVAKRVFDFEAGDSKILYLDGSKFKKSNNTSSIKFVACNLDGSNKKTVSKSVRGWSGYFNGMGMARIYANPDRNLVAKKNWWR